MGEHKHNFAKIIHKRMISKDKVYGTTTVGARGQVVVPAEARKDLGIKPGDQLLVMGKFGKALGFIKVEELEGVVEAIMKNFQGSGMGPEIKNHMQGVLKNLQNFKK